jgi:hypothetical protein
MKSISLITKSDKFLVVLLFYRNLFGMKFLGFIVGKFWKTEEKQSNGRMPLGNIGKDNVKLFLRDLFAKLVYIISSEHMLAKIIQTKSNHHQESNLTKWDYSEISANCFHPEFSFKPI